MKGRVRLIRFTVAIAVLVGVVFSTSAASAPNKAKSPLTILVVSSTNSTNFYPSSWIAAEAAAANINAAGGVNGHSINIVRCDCQSTPAGSLACMQRAKDIGAVAEIVSADSSFGVNADFMVSNQIVGLGVTGNPPDYQSPAVFTFSGAGTVAILAQPFALKKAGATKIAALVIAVPATIAYEPIIAQTASAAGANYLGPIEFPSTTTDYSPYVQKLKDEGADGVLLIGSIGASIGVLNAAQAIGYHPKWASQLQTFGSTSRIAQANGLAEGMIVTGSLPPFTANNYPIIKQFNHQVGEHGLTYGQRTFTEESAWVSVYAFAYAARTMSDPIDHTAFYKTLSNWGKKKPINLFNLFSWTPGAPGPAALPRIANMPFWIAVVKNGRPTLEDKTAYDLMKEGHFSRGA